jgi:hypothetical protein
VTDRRVPVEKRKRKVPVKPIKRAGRPSVYDPAYHPPHALKFCLLGCTDLDLAHSFDVDESAIHRWMNEHEAFRNSVVSGRQGADAHVAQSLYHRATGYSFPSEKIQFDRDGNELRAQFVEHCPPDPGSAMFWLKNRRRNQWRDTPAVAVGVQANGNNVNVTMNTGELSQGYMQIISGDNE